MFRHKWLLSPRSIRLLRLHASTNIDDSLVVELFEVCLDATVANEHRYEALSYVWGEPRGTRPLLCNGKQLLVTPNCESALKHFRAQWRIRILWVDAICINQEETNEGLMERNIQVPLMGEIYSKATKTLCWLGEGTRFTGDVVRHLERIAACPSRRALSKLMYLEEQLQKTKIVSDESSCLDHIFCHPWHSRLWTIQEVAFSSNCQVACGNSTISWKDYSAAAEFLIYEQFIGSLDLQAAKSMVSIDMRNVFRNYLISGQPSDTDWDEESPEDAQARKIIFLTSCLTDVNQLQVTDPRDKIYGLYALYTHLGVPLPAVDYEKPVTKVYTDAALAMITWSKSLTILRDACSTIRDHALPSWVPDWNDTEVRMSMLDRHATEKSRIMDTTPEVLSPGPGRLCVRGRPIGKVKQTEIKPLMMPFPTHSESSELPILSDTECRDIGDIQFLRLFVEKIVFFRSLLRTLRTSRLLCRGEDPTDIFYEILTQGAEPSSDLFDTLVDILAFPDGQCDQSFGYNLAEVWRAADSANASSWTSELICSTTIAASLLSSSIRNYGEILSSHFAILELLKGMSQNLADQAVISVERQFDSILGTTFRTVEAGDVIVLARGADWPIVLRQNDKEWIFIGPAFLIGIRNGDAGCEESSDVGGFRDFVLV